MASRDVLGDYVLDFNGRPTFWSFTKALAVRPDVIGDVVQYHEVLRSEVIGKNREWNPSTQQEYVDSVAPGAGAAWGRELQTLFNLLGTAWVEAHNEVKLTDVGREFLRSADPLALLERQVRKYQISNPQLQLSNTLTGDISIIPHYVLLEFLITYYPIPLTREEFIYFLSRIRSEEDFPIAMGALEAFRGLSGDEKLEFRSMLDEDLVRKIGRIFSYAANFLALPRYLEYRPGSIRVSNFDESQRVLSWYRLGHETAIEFESLKDWYSHYGNAELTANPLAAADYYRSIGRVEESTAAYSKALQKGMTPLEGSPQDYRCRVQGEKALEGWLTTNLHRSENGLVFVERQYETEEAGRIDILARDSEGKYVVVELKRDKASDVALGQLLRYLGWVRVNLSAGDSVRGYVVGDTIDDRMLYAIFSHDILEEICKLRQYSDLGIRLNIQRSAEECSAEVVELV